MDEPNRTAVRAVVHARLLGIRLLTLDAQVVIGPAPAVGPVDRAFYPIERDAPLRAPAAAVAPSVSAAGNGRSRGLAEASQLLAASSEALARTRRSTRTR